MSLYKRLPEETIKQRRTFSQDGAKAGSRPFIYRKK
jgi:hypothetical protein